MAGLFLIAIDAIRKLKLNIKRCRIHRAYNKKNGIDESLFRSLRRGSFYKRQMKKIKTAFWDSESPTPMINQEKAKSFNKRKNSLSMIQEDIEREH